MKRIVVKVGTSVLTHDDGSLNLRSIRNITEQIVAIKKQKIDVVLISSGACGAGKNIYKENDFVKKKDLLSKDKITQRQVFASIGQPRLLHRYLEAFLLHNFFCAQILVTKEDFRDRGHFLNMSNCMHALLSNQIVPIINENDAISIDERMFSDNDELAGMISTMVNADKLVIMTNVDGLFTGDPKLLDSKLIEKINPNDNWRQYIQDTKSSMGRGGMKTKCQMADKLARLGVETILVNGERENAMLNVINNEIPCTRFVAHSKVSSIKKWIAVSEDSKKGSIIVNKGAEEAISQNGGSLLPIGAIGVSGNFKKGDIVAIKNKDGETFALGVARYDIERCKERIGKPNQKPMVHRDALFLG
ncbi:MAG: glutamate 5-kinase [Candidatus Gracilibacteria bacterium]|jgi:glutamate 5-kinase|nr:glutamate 5-kinase [Candidatus Gracilibacteria bacterium]